MAEPKYVDKSKVVLREIVERDLDFLYDICEEQGWFVSQNELACWFKVFHDSFVVLEFGGEYIGSINVLNMNDTHAFVGTFVVRKEYRYQGLGKILWNEGLKKAGGRSIVLCSHEHEFDMYVKKGFQIEKAVPMKMIEACKLSTAGADETVKVTKAGESDREEVADYDASIYEQFPRREYISHWLVNDDTVSFVARKGKKVVGFLVSTHYKNNVYAICPLEADSLGIAKSLMRQVLDLVPHNATFCTQILARNQEAESLFDKREQFRTAQFNYISTGEDCPPNESKVWFRNHPAIFRG